MSEITERAVEIKALAAKCETLHDLMSMLKWPMHSVIAANEILGLGLPVLRPDRPGKPRPGVESPKPVAKKK